MLKISFPTLPALAAVCLSLNPVAYAAPRLEYRTSKILGLYDFMRAVSGGRRGSEILLEAFRNSRFDTPEKRKLIEEFRLIRERHFDHDFQFHGYPAHRGEMSWDVDQFFDLQSAKSADIDDFAGRTAQVLPASEHRRMFSILRAFLPAYEELVWNPNQEKLGLYLTKLKSVGERADVQGLFEKAVRFYGGTWPDDVPLVIYLGPIPSDRGHTTATMIADSALVEALLGEKDFPGRFGVVFHEICHGVFESQPLDLQREMDSWFKSADSSKYGDYAYKLINEALATALGNGLAFRAITGAEDRAPWYDNPEIDEFARSIYPRVAEYFDAGKTMDRDFVLHAVEQYKKRFPEAPFSYDKFMEEVVLITDGVVMKSGPARAILKKFFRVRSLASMSPLAKPETIAEMKAAPGEALLILIVSPQERSQLRALEEAVAGLRRWSRDLPGPGQWVFTGFDADRRPVLVFQVDDPPAFEALLEKIKKKKILKAGEVIKIS